MNNRNVLLIVLGGGKSKVLAGLVSVEGLLSVDGDF